MLRRWDVLVVCAEMRNRNAFARMHKGVSASDLSCSTLTQTMEVLSSHKMELVFCDENLSDGSFPDLLRTNQLWIGRPHIVVIVHRGEWAEHLEALQRRVFEVISSPLHPTGVELAVIRIKRDGVRESFFQVSALRSAAHSNALHFSSSTDALETASRRFSSSSYHCFWYTTFLCVRSC